MYIVTVTYPKSAGASFDFDYFKSKHLPEVGKAFKPYGARLRQRASRRGKYRRRRAGLFRDDDPGFFRRGSRAQCRRVGCREGAGRGIPNFTSVTPVMQFNTAVR